MADIRYLIDIELGIHSEEPSAKLARVGDAAAKLRSSLLHAGEGLLDGFTGAVERVGGIVADLGKVGIAAAVGAASYGVIGLNKELEVTQSSLGAVLNANGIGGGLAGSMALAGGWMSQIRKDAAALPGEFKDLLGIVQSGAGAAFEAGLDVERYEKLASQTMAAAKALGVNMPMAGREFAQLLEGRAGAHNVLGMRLGIHAQGFNTASDADRVAIIEKQLKRFEPAIEMFKTTMDASSGALIDNVKLFLGTATLPLFDKIKGAIVDVNAWFDTNQTKVHAYADKIGSFLEDAFNEGKKILFEYGPLLIDFAGRTWKDLWDVWKDAEPYVVSIGKEIKSFLKDDGSFDKIKTILELYIAAKGLSGVISVGKTVAPILGAASQMGLFGGGAAAAEGGAAAGAIGGGEAVGGALAALGISAGTAALALAALAVPVAASVYYMGKAEEENAAVRENYVRSLVDATITYATGIENATGMIDTGSSQYLSTLEMLRSSSESAADSYRSEVEEHNRMLVAAAQLTDSFVKMNTTVAKMLLEMPHTDLKMDPSPFDLKSAGAAKRNAASKGSGNTYINSVEISVSTNQNPGQVARSVGQFLAHQSRHRRSSPYAPNFSSARGSGF